MYDQVQKFSTTLKTVFTIKVDQDCEIDVKDSAGNAICADAELKDRVFSCEAAQKFEANNFTIEISGADVNSKSYQVESVRNENFVYAVDKEIHVEKKQREYTVNVTAEGLDYCPEDGISFEFVDAENEESILAGPVAMKTCSEVVKFNGTAGTKVIVRPTNYP